MFNFFKKTNEPKNLKELLVQFEKIKEDLKKTSKEVEGLKNNIQITIQKVGIIRFTPFKEIGGDQSFSIALLDKNDNGIVVTSIYSKERSRIFAKPIENGQSTYKLSREEEETIQKAKKIKINNDKEK